MAVDSDEINDVAIGDALRRPGGLFVEADCPVPRRAPGLRLAVRTRTAFSLPLAAVIVAVASERIDLSPDSASIIELALHEAIANAVMHGNLGIHNSGRDGIDRYSTFCEEIEEHLNDAVAAHRCVTINLWWDSRYLHFAVADEGAGFELVVGDGQREKTHGRGLLIMQSLAQRLHWNQRRRRLLLTFPLTSDAQA